MLLSLAPYDHYLHNGGTLTLRNAVLAHGGEAQIARDRFFDLARPSMPQVFVLPIAPEVVRPSPQVSACSNLLGKLSIRHRRHRRLKLP